jgi:hypothetical protein
MSEPLPTTTKLYNLAKVLRAMDMGKSATTCEEAADYIRILEHSATTDLTNRREPHPASLVDIAGIPWWLPWALGVAAIGLFGATIGGAIWLLSRLIT